MQESDRIERAVEYIKDQTRKIDVPKVGIVLGSGLGAVADRLEDGVRIPYGEIPGYHKSAVAGHKGCLCIGHLGGTSVAVMQGRIHLYEGHSVADVVLPIRVLVRLGCQNLIVTNAAGGINEAFQVGDLMLITDHLNLTATNPLVGPNDDQLGVRFPDMTNAYDKEMRRVALELSKSRKVTVRTGVYAGMLGPSYETPAEINMLRTMGADAVGMSTVLEVIAAHHMGAQVLGISCISNAAAGMSGEELSHEEVKEAADAVEEEFSAFVTDLASRFGA
uniref:Purine nucleoside phosphorylase n=1 Tax=uncultured myxobacterium HF0070_11L13 TaxID=723554 RepID=E7C1Z7_9BACT|nr:purine nucleoside phosphorylase [uncultured myxobacterium HF0070_11L13]